MRITVCAVGRLKAGPERELIERFSKRIQWPLEIREVEEKRNLSTPERIDSEARLLDAACPTGSVRVALDERGRTLASAELAERLGDWRDAGRDLAFLLGGADGLAPVLRDGADLVLSFGAATWPHMLARVMLVEQIYRCQEILAGHPYHRE